MNRIYYAAFHEDFVEPAREIFRRLNRDVRVEVWRPELLPEMLRDGVQAILARGATAIRIRKMTDVPIVEIPIPFEDMVDALIIASSYGKNIGVIGYNNLLGGLELLNPILNVKIRQVFAKDTEDTYRQIVRWKEEQVDVVVGGLIQTHFAKELQMKYVRIDLSEKALDYACQEAEKIINSMMAATRKTEELRAVFNTTRENYIGVDIQGKITLVNQTASRFLPCTADQVYGKPLDEVFPALRGIRAVLQDGKEIIQETASLRGTEVLYDMIPLKYRESQVLGAIVTFNDIHTITRGEYKIRDKVKKGFYAQYQFSDILGESDKLAECVKVAKKYGQADFAVLILGETGVGKEMFAQSIHRISGRRDGPFVAVNCAALPEGILESELFGYEEGAFTGARKNGKMGLFELAHRGTIFLDEISEMPLSLQSRLLRVLQEKRVMRLGGDSMMSVDIRVFAATNHNLVSAVREKRFREDLFYRLNVLTLKIPPLRERKSDIPILAGHFFGGGETPLTMTEDAWEALKEYQWPGNVRQLVHFIEKVKIISDTPRITGKLVRQVIWDYEPVFSQEGSGGSGESHPLLLEEVESALAQCGGNKSQAARCLGVHRTTFWRYLKKYGLDR